MRGRKQDKRMTWIEWGGWRVLEGTVAGWDILTHLHKTSRQ